MNNMYIKIEEGRISDITNNKVSDNIICLGVKYFLGREHVLFSQDSDGGLFVERFKGDQRIYRYKFMHCGEYMLTPLFVDTYKSSHPQTREIYSYLKSNLSGKFYLEENQYIDTPYKISLTTWIDRIFSYKYTVRINPNTIQPEHLQEIKYLLYEMENQDLLELHRHIDGRSIYVTEKSLEVIASNVGGYQTKTVG